MKSLGLPPDQFNSKKQLEAFCKRSRKYSEQEELEHLEIDFLAIEKQISELQLIQQKTYEQIVEFVDQHRDSFIEINNHFDKIQDKIKKSESILKLLGSRIQKYKTDYYLTESKIQSFINHYELSLISDQILNLVKQETKFLIQFNHNFQKITNEDLSELTLTQRHLISRFTLKLDFIKILLSHQIIKNLVPENLQINQLVTGLSDQLEFYLGEQLAKISSQCVNMKQQSTSNLRKKEKSLQDLKMWYLNLHKIEEYYKIFEENLIGQELNNCEKVLLTNKISLMSGKDPQLIESFFKRILSAVDNFPSSYSEERIKNILFTFLKKEELKFLYTHAMPIFPISFQSYMDALSKSKVSESIKKQLKDNHNWNLKMWVMVRQKNILDRSNGDHDLFKWLEIIFKSNCMIEGTVSDFIKLAFKIINRFLTKAKNSQFKIDLLNRLIQFSQKIGNIISQKITLYFPKEAHPLGKKIEISTKIEITKTLDEIFFKNFQLILSSCQDSLEPVKSFVSKIVKKDKQVLQKNLVNKPEVLFKPINSFIMNNPELKEQTRSYLKKMIQQVIIKFYDQIYVPEIYSYAKEHLTSDQLSIVMEIVGRERTHIFLNAPTEKEIN